MQIDRERDQPTNDPYDKAAPFAIPDCVPVFALPNVVLFPKTYLPLHIFEPRYRQMVADAALQGHCIAMALLKEGWETDYYGHPPIYPVGCVGRLVSVQRLPDGRSNILLQGLERYEIHEEFFEKPYREARVTIREATTESSLAPEVRQALMTVLEQYLRAREDAATWEGMFRNDMNDETLVNTLATYLDCTPLEKQFLIEAEGLHQRARRLCDLIQFMVHDQHGAKGWG